nr:hypothetical protein [Tanacetum cinerariifolium]
MESSDKDTAFYKRGRRPEQNSPDMGPDNCGDIVELFCGGWVLIYAMFSHEAGSWLVDLTDHFKLNVNSMNYVYAYSIATGQWVDRRVDHTIVANPRVSRHMLTNGL